METSVIWQESWRGPSAEYLTDYVLLIGDRRTAVTFGAVVQGTIGAGKTTLSAGLAYEPTISAAFPDGILWATADQGDVLAFEEARYFDGQLHPAAKLLDAIRVGRNAPIALGPVARRQVEENLPQTLFGQLGADCGHVEVIRKQELHVAKA